MLSRCCRLTRPKLQFTRRLGIREQAPFFARPIGEMCLGGKAVRVSLAQLASSKVSRRHRQCAAQEAYAASFMVKNPTLGYASVLVANRDEGKRLDIAVQPHGGGSS